MILPDGRKSPSTPDLLYPHTHLTGPGASAANHPINQNGLPVFNLDSDRREDLNLDVDRQQALFYSSADLLNSNVSADGTTSLGMVSHKMSLITIFGHKHFRQIFKKKFQQPLILVHIWYQILKQNCFKNEG